ncbi:MAG TPA: PQQ-binding-like beta-propeller repeat protein [Chitinophagaceae bacterium]|nr:PQQ-binding-like beta-propeller repeat protein [Chitinophagaceae bacterium]
MLSKSGRYIRLPVFFLWWIFLSESCHSPHTHTGWTVYGGSKTSLHYSSLRQIDTDNVGQLRVAWVYHTGDADTVNHSQIECNPIMVDGVLYGTSPGLKLFALDASDGKPLWVFNPFDSIHNKGAIYILNVCRGVTYWSDGYRDQRIFYTAGSFLWCVNAATGKPEAGFGHEGRIDLHKGLGRDVSNLFVTATSPGIIFHDLIIMGTRVDEGPDAAPGHIRAFDVRTGKEKWIFHTIPWPGEYGYHSWEDPQAWQHIGGVNNWCGMSLDEKRGILYVPLGSASPDFYGGTRRGKDLFADCLVALHAATGKRIWDFQEVHHDLWDRDLPAPPVLLSLFHRGKKVDAVVQTTKTGFVFVFDRVTGKPLFPIRERAVPHKSELAGEEVQPTQPFPELPLPFVRQLFNNKDINRLVPDSSQQDILKRLASYKTGNIFNPPSREGTVIFPGFDGGGEWGGPAADPKTGILYVNASQMPWVLTMVPAGNKMPAKETRLQAGSQLFAANCMSCHGPDMKGSGNYPSLIGANKKYDREQFMQLVSTGRRMMPGFRQLSVEERKALACFVLDIKKDQRKPFKAPPRLPDHYLDLPYSPTGYNKFLTREGYPAIQPPWGSLTAINLNNGQQVWQVALGEYPGFRKKGIITGTENYGGPVVTAGGLVFIAATSDRKIRAFSSRTGKLLWEYRLPVSGFATPSIFSLKGKQFVVIACGGGKLGKASGDDYIAFSLPGP